MNPTEQNPFNLKDLIPGLPLAGREEVTDWLINGIQQGARLLLHGAAGLGKSSVLAQTAAQLQQSNLGILIRIDVSTHRSIGELAAEVNQAADRFSPMLRRGGDRTATPFSPSAVRPSGAEATPDSALFSALDRLNRVASFRSESMAIAFDNFPDLRRLGGALLEQGMRNAFQAHPSLGYILTGKENELSSLLHDPSHPLHDQVQSKALGPVEPRKLANWIDERFSVANVQSVGAGAACVQQGGPRTSSIIDLARRTFELAREARSVNASTVLKALETAIGEKSGTFAKVWENLNTAERKTMKAVAQRGGETPSAPSAADAVEPKSVEAKAAMNSLVERGLVEKIGSAGFHLESPALRGWTLQAQLNVTRERATSTGAPSMHFAFDLRTARQAAASSKTISP